MNITYNINPLKTTIELNPVERDLLFYKVKSKLLQDHLYSIYYHSMYYKSGEFYDDKIIKDYLNPQFYIDKPNDISQLSIDANELTIEYIDALLNTHNGACTNKNSICKKCEAESYLRINTIAGLGSTDAALLNDLYNKHKNDSNGVLTELNTGALYTWLFNYKLKNNL